MNRNEKLLAARDCMVTYMGYVLLKEDKEAGVAIYRDPNKPVGMGFRGNAAKPAWHYRYGSDEKLLAKADEFIADVRKSLEHKASRKAELKAAAENAKVAVGDVFQCSWGYDQTNVDYYEAVAVSGRHVTVRKIAQQREETLRDQGNCVPCPGQYIGEPMKKLVQAYGDSVLIRIYSFANAYLQKPIAKIAGVNVYAASSYTAYA